MVSPDGQQCPSVSGTVYSWKKIRCKTKGLSHSPHPLKMARILQYYKFLIRYRAPMKEYQPVSHKEARNDRTN